MDGQFGHMAALKGNDIHAVPLSEAVSATKRLDLRYYDEAKEFFCPGHCAADPLNELQS